MPAGDERELLESGDRSLAAGDIADACATYGHLLFELRESGRETAEPLLVAVVAHRVGVVEVLRGTDRPAQFFELSEVMLSEAEVRATTDAAKGWVSDLRGQMSRHRIEIVDGVTSVAPLMLATCRHGCPSVTVDCGLQEPHC